MTASVRIEGEAFGDDRYEDLATIAGLADADHARGKMARLWRQCTLEGSPVLPIAYVVRVLGSRAVDALVGARLGEKLDETSVRIRGTKGRIEWLQKLRDNGRFGRKGGRPRKPQNPYGFEKKTPPTPTPSPSPSPTPSLVPEREKTPPPGENPHGFPRPADVGSGDSPELIARRQLGTAAWDRLNALRDRLAKQFGWTDVRPLHPQDPGRTELAARLRESGPEAEANLDHAFAIAEAEAIAKATPEYLSGAMFSPESWRKKLAMRVDDVKRDRAAPRGTSPAIQPSRVWKMNE